jgi:hypothetical protein
LSFWQKCPIILLNKDKKAGYTMDYKKVFERFGDQSSFIKTSEKPAVNGAQKAALNRKGNMLYNSGDVEGARKIFLTTGYSDGLSRVGDFYKAGGRTLDALRMYLIAPDKTKSDPIIMQLASLLQVLIKDEGEPLNE